MTTSNYRTIAQQVHALGFNVTAIASNKKPGHTWREYQETRQSATDLDRLPWAHASGLGAISGVGGLRIFDFDKCGDLAAAHAALRALDLPDSYPWLWRSGSGNGWGLAVVCFEDIPPGVLSSNGNGPGVFEAPGIGFDHLELRWRDCQTLLPPSQHPTGPGYRWQNGAPTAPPATVTADQVIAAFRAVTLRPQPVNMPPVPTTGHGSGYAAAALRDELDHLGRATEGTRNATLNRCAFNLGQLVAGGELHRDDVERDLLAVALRIGLGEGEAAATIKSGLDAGAREPRTAPPPTLRPGPPRTSAPVPDEPPAWSDATPEPPPWLDKDDLAERVQIGQPARPAATPKPDLSECPPLPDDAQLAPDTAAGASPWLDRYEVFSREWSPQSWDGYHVNVGLGILSAVAARRVTYHFGGERFTSLMLANLGRSSIWAKSTAQKIGRQMLSAAGLDFLLVSDTTTPQALVARMAATRVSDWDSLTPEKQESAKLRLAFAGQRGWLADEFGAHIGGMMRSDGPMGDFLGLLRVLDDGLDRYSSDTIARGNAVIERPYLSLLVSFTPADVLKWAGRGGPLWTNGFWARFAFTCPPPGARGTDARFPDGACNPPSDLVRTLRQWHERLGIPEVEVTERLDDAGKPLKERSWQTLITHAPAMTIGYSEPVKDAVYAYRNALRRLTEDFAVSDFDGSYSRFPEKALRVAALFASIEDSRYITMRHWARAQGIAETWRQSLHDLYQTLNTKQDEKAEREDKIVDICTRLNGATVAELRQYIRGLSIAEATQLSDQLVKAGVLRVETTRKGTNRYLPVEPETN